MWDQTGLVLRHKKSDTQGCKFLGKGKGKGKGINDSSILTCYKQGFNQNRY